MIIHPKDDLRRAIETTLDISIDFFLLKAAAPKVNDFDSTFGWMAQKHVLGF
jgi:hypothetical protein